MATPNNPDETALIRRLEELGPAQVRLLMSNGGWAHAFHPITLKWLTEKYQEAERLQEASQAAQAAAASRAVSAAERASEAAERQARAAESANTRATIALIIAIVSMIATVIGIWIVHLDTMHPH
jgi:hypothetical protein